MTSAFPDGSIALVQGASRGIGLEFVRQLAAWPQFARIYASARNPQASEELCRIQESDPGRIRLLTLDVTSAESIDQAVRAVRSDGTDKLNLLLNVAGVLHDGEGLFPEKQLSEVDPAMLMRSFQVNAFGPLLVTQAFESLMTHGEHAVLASLSARVGSIEDNRLGGWYAYRGAKAAQNMFTRNLSVELGRKSRRLVCVALHPGTTDTGLSAPFQRRVPSDKLFSTSRTVGQLLDIIAGLCREDNGRFIAWDGQDIPW